MGGLWRDAFGNEFDFDERLAQVRAAIGPEPEVEEIPYYKMPFDIYEDPWADITFVRCILKDIVIPPPKDDSGIELPDPLLEMMRKERKEMQRLHLCARPRKKGRTARERRRLSLKKWREEKEKQSVVPFATAPAADTALFLENIGKLNVHWARRHEYIQVFAGYDEHVFRHTLPSGWRTTFWMLSFVDDLRDYRLFIVDKSKEVAWPAERRTKRELGYELLEFMPGGSVQRSASMAALDKQSIEESEEARAAAGRLRRSRSLTDLPTTASGINLIPEEELEMDYEEIDILMMITEAERQDDIDLLMYDFYYTA